MTKPKLFLIAAFFTATLAVHAAPPANVAKAGMDPERLARIPAG